MLSLLCPLIHQREAQAEMLSGALLSTSSTSGKLLQSQLPQGCCIERRFSLSPRLPSLYWHLAAEKPTPAPSHTQCTLAQSERRNLVCVCGARVSRVSSVVARLFKEIRRRCVASPPLMRSRKRNRVCHLITQAVPTIVNETGEGSQRKPPSSPCCQASNRFGR